MVRRLGTDGQWASALVYGTNKSSAQPDRSHSLLLESEAILDRSNTLIGRAEYVQKRAEDLVVDAPSPFGFVSDRKFTVSSVSLGYIRELVRQRGATIGLGVMGTVNMVSAELETAYGSRTPLGGVIFVRLRPFHVQGKAMSGMGPMKMED